MSVPQNLRHSRARRCPVCDGADGDTRGQGKRCHGYTSADGKWTFCSQVESDHWDENAKAWRHLLRDEPRTAVAARRVAEYVYTTEAGEPHYRRVRLEPKRFFYEHMEGGVWVSGRNGQAPTLYHLHELATDDADRTVYFVEGEKDADNLAAKGFLTTTNGAAGDFPQVRDVARAVLAGRDVVIIADRDGPEAKFAGQKHARAVAEGLRGVVRSLRVLVPKAPVKDISDVLEAGGTLEDLVELGEHDESPLDALRHIVTDSWLLTEPPSRDYLLRDIRTGKGALTRSSTLISAAGGLGKSFAMLWLTLTVGTGAVPWLGYLNAAPGRALLVTVEDDKNEIERRLFYVAKSLGVTLVPAGAIEILDLHGQDFALLNKDRQRTAHAATLLEHVRRYGPFDLIVLDPIGRISGCELDGDNLAAAALVNYLDALADIAHGAVVGMHHTDKTARRQKIHDATASKGATGLSDYTRATIIGHLETHVFEDEAITERLGEIVVFGCRKSNYTAKWKDIELRRGPNGELLALDEVDRHIVAEARKPKSKKVAAVEAKAQRAQLELELSTKKATDRENAIRARNDDDDKAARAYFKQFPNSTTRNAIAHLKAVRACGTTRASDAVQRVRQSGSLQQHGNEECSAHAP